MSKVTPSSAQEMAELLEAGWSYKRISMRFGVTKGAVHYHCLQQGAVSPRTRRQNVGPGVVVCKNGVVQRRFSPAEDAEIDRLATGGKTPTQIARALKRPYTSIRVRILTLGLRADGYGISA